MVLVGPATGKGRKLDIRFGELDRCFSASNITNCKAWNTTALKTAPLWTSEDTQIRTGSVCQVGSIPSIHRLLHAALGIAGFIGLGVAESSCLLAWA